MYRSTGDVLTAFQAGRLTKEQADTDIALLQVADRLRQLKYQPPTGRVRKGPSISPSRWGLRSTYKPKINGVFGPGKKAGRPLTLGLHFTDQQEMLEFGLGIALIALHNDWRKGHGRITVIRRRLAVTVLGDHRVR